MLDPLVPHRGVNWVEGSGCQWGDSERSAYVIFEDAEMAAPAADLEVLGQPGSSLSEEPPVFQRVGDEAGGLSVSGKITRESGGAGCRVRLPRPRVVPTEPLPLPADQESEEFPIAPRSSREPSPVPVPEGVMRRLEGRQASPPRGDGPWRKSADTLAKEWEAQRRQTAAQGRNRRVGDWHVSVVRRAAGELWKYQKMWADAGRAALLENDVEAGRVKERNRGEPRLVRRGLPEPSLPVSCPALSPQRDSSLSGWRSTARPVNVYDELDFWRGVFDEGCKDEHADSLSCP